MQSSKAFFLTLVSITISAIIIMTLILPSIGLIREAEGATIVSGGTIATNTTWDSAGSPYWITGNLYIEEEATLTIEEGVEVRFEKSRSLALIVNGTLKALGNGTNKVVFRSNATNPGPGDWDAIEAYQTGRVELKDVLIEHAAIGIYLEGTNNSTLEGVLINRTSDYGLHAKDTKDTTIANSTFSHLKNGIKLEEAENLHMTNITVDDITNFGVIMYYCQNVLLANSSISNTNEAALKLEGTYYTNIMNNSINESGDKGILLYTSQYNVISGNVITGATTNGISNIYSNSNRIHNNTIVDSGDFHLYISLSSAVLVEWNNLVGLTTAPNGVYLEQVTNSEVVFNNISGNVDGICLSLSSYNNVSSNVIHQGMKGILLTSSSNYNTIEANTISETENSLVLSTSRWNNIRANALNDGKKPITHPYCSVGDFDNHINVSNTVNLLPVHYYYDVNNLTIQNLDAGQVIVAASENIIIANNTLQTAGNIHVAFSKEISLINNTVNDTHNGIIIQDSSTGQISDNDIRTNSTALTLIRSNSLSIINNLVTSMDASALYLGYSNLNSLQFNVFNSTHSRGMSLWNSDQNGFFEDEFNSINSLAVNISSSDGNILESVPIQSGSGQYAVELRDSNLNTLANITITAQTAMPGNYLLQDCSSNFITGGTQATGTGAMGSIGIRLEMSDMNTISEMNFENWDEGVNLTNSNNNMFFNTTIRDNNAGVSLYRSNANKIFNNTFDDNSNGIHAGNLSYSNLIHFNNFLNSTGKVETHAIDLRGNKWDIPFGGNYWSDHSGVDVDANGRGDLPYLILPAGHDQHPLMYPLPDLEAPIISLLSPPNASEVEASTPIDLWVFDANLQSAEYILDSGAVSILAAPFVVDSTQWTEGMHFLNVSAIDIFGRSNSSFYEFIVDSPPVIELATPLNNSVINSGTTIRFTIADQSLHHAEAALDQGAYAPLPTPYEINTSGWSQGSHVIWVKANDTSGKWRYSGFDIIIDDVLPQISLTDLVNSDVIKPGTAINLSMTEPNILVVEYSSNGGPYIGLTAPYNISTEGWVDGSYSLMVRCSDRAGNVETVSYGFTLDSILPVVTLLSPEVDEIIPQGVKVILNVYDQNPGPTHYSVDYGAYTSLPADFQISLATLVDGQHIFHVLAIDAAGNQVIRSYRFKLDTIEPDIILMSPENNTLIASGTQLQFNIVDENISSVLVEGGNSMAQTLNFPYLVDTTGWPDGTHTITIKAVDEAGNSAEKDFAFLLDKTQPRLDGNTPLNNAIDVSINISMILSFSETMDTISVVVKLDPLTPYTLHWSNDNTTLTMIFSLPLDYDTVYNLTVEGDSADIVGWLLLSQKTILFTTEISLSEDSDDDGIPDYWEKRHSLDPDNATDALLDDDGDEYSNIDEYRLGTDPQDATSFPVSTVTPPDDDQLIIMLVGVLAVLSIVAIIALAWARKSVKASKNAPTTTPANAATTTSTATTDDHEEDERDDDDGEARFMDDSTEDTMNDGEPAQKEEKEVEELDDQVEDIYAGLTNDVPTSQVQADQDAIADPVNAADEGNFQDIDHFDILDVECPKCGTDFSTPKNPDGETTITCPNCGITGSM